MDNDEHPVTIPTQAVAGIVRDALRPDLRDLLDEVRHYLGRIEQLLDRLVARTAPPEETP
jgi:Ethanolamine utilization protein EutJ (predicted chaperonin)